MAKVSVTFKNEETSESIEVIVDGIGDDNVEEISARIISSGVKLKDLDHDAPHVIAMATFLGSLGEFQDS